MAEVFKFPQRTSVPLAEEDTSGDNFPLPSDLPRPLDDGACDHLIGMRLPPVALLSTAGHAVNLAASDAPETVIFSYVMTGVPGQYGPPGWDMIPGARGGTPEARAFRDRHAEFVALGAKVYGLSAQSSAIQREMAERLRLPFPVLSDSAFAFSDALRLPTFTVEDQRFIKRLTLVVRGGTIAHVFYPVFPADENADRVLYWLQHH